MDGNLLLERALLFDKELDKIKKQLDSHFPWYPYGSLNNFVHLRDIFNKRRIDTLVVDHSTILDIGAADGDISFFLESLGYRINMIDNGLTNFNQLKGARLLKEKLKSRAEIYEMDLDSQFQMPANRYDLIFFLGILYHLKNPFYVLEHLSRVAKHLLLSTRVARFTPDGLPISKAPLAYLLGPDEANGDSTNYWIFSDAGFRRLLSRSGWNILEITTVGDSETSNPRDQDHDERTFALLRSQNI